VDLYIAQIISILTAVVAILSMQMKTMKSILITQITANLLASSTYFLLDGFSGAGISLIAIIQLIVMFIYNKNNRSPHLLVIIGFIIAYVTYSIFILKGFIDIFPALAAICFALGIAQKNPTIFRFWGLLNPLCWLVYDIYTMAYVSSLMRLGIFISALIAMIRLDGLFKTKNKQSKE